MKKSFFYIFILACCTSCEKAGFPDDLPDSFGDFGCLCVNDTTSILIFNTGVTPGQMKVKKGVSVNWHNADPYTHNIVSYDGLTFNSADIRAGSSFRYETITPGVFAYRCTIHGDAGGALYVNP